MLGTQGRGRLSRGILGSVAEKVLRSTKGPALTVGPLRPRALLMACRSGASCTPRGFRRWRRAARRMRWGWHRHFTPSSTFCTWFTPKTLRGRMAFLAFRSDSKRKLKNRARTGPCDRAATRRGRHGKSALTHPGACSRTGNRFAGTPLRRSSHLWLRRESRCVSHYCECSMPGDDAHWLSRQIPRRRAAVVGQL